MNDYILEVCNLTVEAGTGRRLLDDVSFTMEPGEVLGVVGESGAGKSVLVRSLLLLFPENVHVTSGVIRYRDQDILRLPARELRELRGKEIAHILPGAKSQLNPVVRIGDMMTAVLRVHHKVRKIEARERVAAALSMVGIPDPARRLSAYAHELSGGMAQRVCIALALLQDPDLIIADEPTAGLDVTVQRQVLDLMAALVRQHRATQLYVTRDLGIVAQYCHRVAVMQAGRIIETASTEELFDSPQEAYTKKLLAAVRVARRSRVGGMGVQR